MSTEMKRPKEASEQASQGASDARTNLVPTRVKQWNQKQQCVLKVGQSRFWWFGLETGEGFVLATDQIVIIISGEDRIFCAVHSQYISTLKKMQSFVPGRVGYWIGLTRGIGLERSKSSSMGTCSFRSRLFPPLLSLPFSVAGAAAVSGGVVVAVAVGSPSSTMVGVFFVIIQK